MRISMFYLKWPQWSNIGGGAILEKNGGQIKGFYKYIMWGIKLEDLILQAYLNGAIMEIN